MDKESLTLNEIQQESLKILIKIDEICRKLDLKYFLAYGTLIGAIRHKGFIPWDDDIDIMMPRKDYIELKKYFDTHEEELKPLKICTRENVKNYEYYIPRVSNTNFKYINMIKRKPDVDLGTFVDIYPIDNFGNDDSAKEIVEKIRKINEEYVLYISGISNTQLYKTIIKYPLHLIKRLKRGKNYHLRINKTIDDIIAHSFSDDDKYVGVPAWIFRFVQYKREWMNDLIEVEFEGHKFYAPKNYDEILKLEYGNYMELPPENQRFPHHDYKIVPKNIK